MTPQEQERIRKWNSELSGDLQISFLITEDKRSRGFIEFSENLTNLAPKIRIVKEEGEPEEAPAIQIGHGLRYHAIPVGTEDEQFRWTGSLRLEELVEIMTNRDPAKLGTSTLKRMLKEGNAAQLAEMMLDKERIFPAFLDLLIHKKWPIRLGAMVAMEEIADRNSELAAQVIDPLWERFHQVEDPVKGDIVYILGESGDYKIVPRLQMILDSQYNTEVKEAAKEAIEKITHLCARVSPVNT
ncbi:MAG: hypothetical protein KAU38_02480 [Desulfobacterales bacterium]|nr:hypothetical protein [Desulfobacterales bacterium]